MNYYWDKLNFKGLNKTKDFDYDWLKNNVKITMRTFDKDGKGNDYYTLVKYKNKYYILYSWSRGYDAWGFEYEIDDVELIKQFIKNNDEGHPFIIALKNYFLF